MVLRLSLPWLSAALVIGSATALHAADLTAVATAVVRPEADTPAAPADRCPYATIHVDWPRAEADLSSEDSADFASIAAAYLAALPPVGFTVVTDRSQAYWHALLRLRRSRQNPQVVLTASTILARGES